MTKRTRNQASYPNILIDSIPLTFCIEKKIIKEGQNVNDLRPYLLESARKLQRAGVDFLIMPCNTAHIFERDLRKNIDIPFLSIIDATLNKVRRAKFKRIGLLATKETVKSKIYQLRALEYDIAVVCPSASDQIILDGCIINLLDQTCLRNEGELFKVINGLRDKGVEAIVLGCTDLYQIIKKQRINIPIIDSTEVLIDKTLKELTKV